VGSTTEVRRRTAREKLPGRLFSLEFDGEHPQPPTLPYIKPEARVYGAVGDGVASLFMSNLWPRVRLSRPASELDALADAIGDKLEVAVGRRRFPAAMLEQLRPVHLPLAAWLAERAARSQWTPPIIGFSGAPGSGKTTLCHWLGTILTLGFELQCTVITLDDFYLSQLERKQLARDVHPLLRTRGVPGTHDVAALKRALAALAELPAGDAVSLPRFDKGSDDRISPSQWPAVCVRPDLVLLEGWCLGATPEKVEALVSPLNALERREDPEGVFRRHVNAQLRGPYAKLFARLEALVFLQVPSLGHSRRWRAQQEAELRAREGGTATLDDEELLRFSHFFERTCRHMLQELPGHADLTLVLDDAHRVEQVVAASEPEEPEES